MGAAFSPRFGSFNGLLFTVHVLEELTNLRLFNNSVFECLEALTYLDPRLRGDDGQSRTVVIPAKAGI